MPGDAKSESDSPQLDEVRELLENQPENGADWADLLDYVDRLERDGYAGDIQLDPDARAEDVLFEAGLAAGYACGFQDGGRDGQ